MERMPQRNTFFFFLGFDTKTALVLVEPTKVSFYALKPGPKPIYNGPPLPSYDDYINNLQPGRGRVRVRLRTETESGHTIQQHIVTSNFSELFLRAVTTVSALDSSESFEVDPRRNIS